MARARSWQTRRRGRTRHARKSIYSASDERPPRCHSSKRALCVLSEAPELKLGSHRTLCSDLPLSSQGRTEMLEVILNFIRRVFGRTPDSTPVRKHSHDSPSQLKPQDGMDSEIACDWYLVGNIVAESEFGEEKVVRSGSKHFTPGTKVYCLPSQWGDGYERVIVVGIRRGSRRWTTAIIKSKVIINWRAKRVCKPVILERLRRGARGHNQQWPSREEVEFVAKMLNERHRKRQKRQDP